MKNYIKKLLVFGFLILNTVAFAFPGDIGSGASGGGDPPAPINDYLIVLLVVGIGIAFFVNARKTKNENQTF